MTLDPLTPREALLLLRDVYKNASVIEYHGHTITINAFTDQSEPLQPALLLGLAQLIVERLGGVCFDIVAGEEDKGAHLVTAVSLLTRVPLVLARSYVYPIASVMVSAVVVDLESEYLVGKLILNGISRGARIVLVEDTISTGGTMIALIKAIRAAGAEVVRAFAVVEKVGPSGVARVLANSGVLVETFLRIQATRAGVSVLSTDDPVCSTPCGPDK
jgi:adenine phosphoribosyltransferase